MENNEDTKIGGEDSNNRPWTTGEINDNEYLAGNDDRIDDTTSRDELLGEGGGFLCRARSADGISMSPLPTGPGLPEQQEELPDDAIVPVQPNGLAGGGLQPCVDVADASDGTDDNYNDVEDVEIPGCVPQPMPRRVSFADEHALDDSAGGSSSSVDSSDQTSSGQIQHGRVWDTQQRRMSSLIGSSNGYLEGNGGIHGRPFDMDGRRRSHVERCQKAVELARAAHELLFTDTRPDGLRPITGSPMTNGRDALRSGGLYVGLAGLKGFDLSFIGALSTNHSGGGQYLGSISARLAASRRLSASTATDGEETVVAISSRAESSSKAGASWIAQGFLLDRKPGSLRPRLPRSARRFSSPEAPQTPPTPTNGGLSGTTDDTAGNAVHNSSGGGGSPKAASSSDLQLSQTTPKTNPTPSPTRPARSIGNAAGVVSPSTELLEQSETCEPPGLRHGSEKKEPRLGGRGTSWGGRRREDMKSEDDGESNAVVSELPEGTTAVSNAATAMASLFAPKAAVLWSARDIGMEELVFSVAGDQEVKTLSKCQCSKIILDTYTHQTKNEDISD